LEPADPPEQFLGIAHRRERIRLAFLGCGRVTTELHLPALRHVPDIQVVALCDVDERRLSDTARPFNGVLIERDIASLLSNPVIEAVAVCTPPSQHAQHAIAVLESGKHLFVEKPLALTLADCDAILASAARGRASAVVGFNLRQHRLLRAARNIIQQGTLGRIELARSLFTTDIRLTRELPIWRDSRAQGGGVLFELGSHHFDMWRWLLGTEVAEVTAMSQSDGRDDSSVSLTARLSTGALATAQMSERTTPSNQIDVFGERARLRVSLYDFDGLEVSPLTNRPGSLGARAHAMARTVRALPAALRGLTTGGDYVATYAEEWRRFCGTLLRGHPPAATLEDGRAAARIAIAAADSATQGRAVRL
jgi:predicted dehydrogenase